jgi:hypothetical protein
VSAPAGRPDRDPARAIGRAAPQHLLRPLPDPSPFAGPPPPAPLSWPPPSWPLPPPLDGAGPDRPTRDRPARGWYLLLVVPIVLPLLTPLYNRLEPTLFGLPFFYWGQLAGVFVDIVVITIVYQATKRRS